jgi:uncharacterized iron-regulated protein
MNSVSFFNIFGAIFLCVILTLPARAEDSIPNYELSVSFDLDENLLRGDALISLPAEKEWTIRTGGMKILKASFEGVALDPETVSEAHEINVTRGGVLELGYEKVFRETETDIENVGVVGSVVSGDGISLTGAWYPQVEGLSYYRLTAVVPESFIAISEADAITEKETPQGREFSFHFPYPSEGMTLAAANYVVSRDVEGDVEVYAYFFEEDAALAEEYIDYTKRYLRMYEEMLGEYPFGRFSVVENFVPTGYSMATYTLLGSDVVRLPFIVETSLGHEILHQWFGNSVYGDPEGGNWLEGITNYLADHLYKVREGEGALYRKKILADYQSYMSPGREMPLEDFMCRVDPATKAVGYGKGAMLFHMLKNLVGEDAFNETLKALVKGNTFKRTSWPEIREAFENTSGMELDDFFTQWLTRADVPHLEVLEPRVLYIDGVPNIEFKLRQKGKPYALRIKVKIITDKVEYTGALDMDEKEKSFKIQVDGSPRLMALDPDYDLMRVLWTDEFPPTISRLLGDEKRLIVIPAEGVGDYLHLTRLLRGEGFNVKLEDEVKDEDLVSSGVLLLGPDGPVHRRLFAKSPVEDTGEGFMITVMKNPLNPDKVLAIAVASGKEEVEASARKIFRYGNYSRLKFIGGRNVEKYIAESDTGMRVSLGHMVSGVRPESAISMEEIIEDVIDSDVIYVGESHTNYEDHRVQLEVIRALYERGRKFAIGMEMFQRPFQEALDAYIAGETTEKEFLKASEYFTRWKFDYHLYREILQYARAHSIPVVALNADADIIKKVSSGGLDALSDEEREKIPKDMDMYDMEYRRKLEEVFGLHKNSSDKKFENFYQSQIIWDETMAHSADEFLSKNPGYQMVVLAGMGHVAWGYGIPNRVHRLNGKDFAILINSNIETIEEGMADYVLFPESLKPLKSPKLGVMLSSTDKGLEITGVQPGSAAAAAKIKKGDIITSVDGFDVQDISDIKIALFDHKAGDTIEVKVLRKRFLAKRKEKALEITLK